MSEFFNMGGYAIFVWSSYAVCFIVMLSIFLWPICARKTILNNIKKAQQRKMKLAKRKHLTK